MESHSASASSRRDFIRNAMLASSALALPSAHANASSNAIVEENRREGARDWQLTRVRVDRDGFRSPWVEGYCSRQSVAPGQRIEVMVSADPARHVRLEVFRSGYYGGRGARKMAEYGPLAAKPQPIPKPGPKNLHSCRWEPFTRIEIPSNWPSGVYLGRLTTIPESSNEPYWQSYVVFIVRAPKPSSVLFQCSDNTWQAYNRWPNRYSVYTDPRGSQGPWADVSFDRPYGREAQWQAIVNEPLSVGSGGWLTFEFPLAFWLEQQGYDVSYCSNSDLIDPAYADVCDVFLSVGHDEYWDIRQFKTVSQLRDAGKSLFFLSGNSVCWVSPLESNALGVPHRVFHRAGPYGGQQAYALHRKTTHGPFSTEGPDEGLLMGVRNIEPVNGGGDWTCTKPDHWVFNGTGMRAGDFIPGLIGWEYLGQPAKEIRDLEVIAAGKAWVAGETPQDWASTIYKSNSGGFVFSASTIWWAQAMSSPPGHTLPWSHWSRPHGPDDRVQTITRNLLNRALQR
jgi:hypothetical protein